MDLSLSKVINCVYDAYGDILGSSDGCACHAFTHLVQSQCLQKTK